MKAYDRVVLTTHGLSTTCIAAADTDNSNRGAGEADQGGNILDDDAQEAENSVCRRRVGLEAKVSMCFILSGE